MATRYWVGGSGTWDSTTTTNWAATSGGAGGQSVPTATDDVIFDVNSGSGIAVTCSSAICANVTGTLLTGTLSGSLTAYGSPIFGSSADVSALTLTLSGTGSYGISISNSVGTVIINSAGGTYTLSAPFTATLLNIQSGNFATNNYYVVLNQFTVTGTATSSVTLGSSTIETASVTFSAGNNFTLNAGTSLIGPTSPSVSVTISTRNSDNAPRTFYDVVSTSSLTLYGLNTFRNVTIQFNLSILDNQTITGALTLNAGTLTARRAMVGDVGFGVRKTLTIASLPVTPVYWDFSDIAIAGAVGTLSGTYLGNRGNNSGITFASPKTVYWVGGTGSWFNATSWALTSGGAPSINNVPLAQDSIVVDNSSGSAGMVISGLTAADSRSTTFITTLDMSTRTTSASVTGSGTTYSIFLLGNLTLGYSGCSVTSVQFYGRSPQTITPNGATIYGPVVIFSTSTVNLAGALTISATASVSPGVLQLITGTLNTNNYNMTITTSFADNCIYSLRSSSWGIFTFALGTSTVSFNKYLTVSGGRAIQFTGISTGKFQVTGAGTRLISPGTSGIYFPTIDNAGNGILQFSGTAKYYNLTNSYKTTGATTIKFSSGSGNSFTLFDLAGEAGRVCTLTSTSTSGRALLAFANNTPINAGATSTDAGNNFGVLFTGAGNGYLSVSYINSVVGQSGFFLI